MSFHFCYFAHFCFFLCILTNPAPEIPLLLFINIRQFPCFETMGRFSLSPCEKECALAHSRAEARLLQQPSTLAPSAHPRGAFLLYGNEVSYTIKRMCLGTFSRRGAVASATIYPCAECASSRSVFIVWKRSFLYDENAGAQPSVHRPLPNCAVRQAFLWACVPCFRSANIVYAAQTQVFGTAGDHLHTLLICI